MVYSRVFVWDSIGVAFALVWSYLKVHFKIFGFCISSSISFSLALSYIFSLLVDLIKEFLYYISITNNSVSSELPSLLFCRYRTSCWERFVKIWHQALPISPFLESLEHFAFIDFALRLASFRSWNTGMNLTWIKFSLVFLCYVGIGQGCPIKKEYFFL